MQVVVVVSGLGVWRPSDERLRRYSAVAEASYPLAVLAASSHDMWAVEFTCDVQGPHHRCARQGCCFSSSSSSSSAMLAGRAVREGDLVRLRHLTSKKCLRMASSSSSLSPSSIAAGGSVSSSGNTKDDTALLCGLVSDAPLEGSAAVLDLAFRVSSRRTYSASSSTSGFLLGRGSGEYDVSGDDGERELEEWSRQCSNLYSSRM